MGTTQAAGLNLTLIDIWEPSDNRAVSERSDRTELRQVPFFGYLPFLLYRNLLGCVLWHNLTGYATEDAQTGSLWDRAWEN